MTDYVYTMKFDPNKLAESIEAYIGSEVSVGASGNRSLSFKIKDTDLTQNQRETIVENLPEFVKLFYSFTRTVVQDDEV